jgi:hypothetical protein
VAPDVCDAAELTSRPTEDGIRWTADLVAPDASGIDAATSRLLPERAMAMRFDGATVELAPRGSADGRMMVRVADCPEGDA